MLDQYIRKFKKKEIIKNNDELNNYLNGLGIKEETVLYTNYNWELENYFRNNSINKNTYNEPVLIDQKDIENLKEISINIDFNEEEIFYYDSF